MIAADAPAEMIEAERLAAEAAQVEIWPEHAAAIDLFLAAITQFRFAGGGMGAPIPTGLDYAGLQATAAMMGKKIGHKLFRQIQIVEAGYLAETHDRAKREAQR